MPTKFNEGIEKRQENKQKNENNIMKKSKKEQKESSRRGRETDNVHTVKSLKTKNKTMEQN